MWKRLAENKSLNKGQRTNKFLIMIAVCAMLISCKPSTEPDPIHNTTIVMTLSDENQNGAITSVAFSPDGETIAAGTDLGEALLWETSNGTIKQTLKAHWCSRVYDISFSPDGNFLVTGIPLDRALIWKVSDGTLVRNLKGGSFVGSAGRHMTSVAYSPDGKTIAGGAYDGSVFLWQASDGNRQLLIMGSWASSSIFDLAFSPDGEILALGKEKSVLLLQVDNWNSVSTIRGSKGTIMSVAFDPSGNLLATGGTDGNTRLINVSDGSVLYTFSTKRKNAVWSLAFSPDGQMLAIGTHDGKIRIWHVKNKTLLYRIDTVEGEVGLDFAPDGETLAIGATDGAVKLWSIPFNH